MINLRYLFVQDIFLMIEQLVNYVNGRRLSIDVAFQRENSFLSNLKLFIHKIFMCLWKLNY